MTKRILGTLLMAALIAVSGYSQGKLVKARKVIADTVVFYRSGALVQAMIKDSAGHLLLIDQQSGHYKLADLIGGGPGGTMTGDAILDSLNLESRTFSQPIVAGAGLGLNSGDTIYSTAGAIRLAPDNGSVVIQPAEEKGHGSLQIYNETGTNYLQMSMYANQPRFSFVGSPTYAQWDVSTNLDSTVFYSRIVIADTLALHKAVKFADGSVQISGAVPMTAAQIMDTLNAANRTFTMQPRFEAGIVLGENDSITTATAGDDLILAPTSGRVRIDSRGGEEPELRLVGVNGSDYLRWYLEGVNAYCFLSAGLAMVRFTGQDSFVVASRAGFADTVEIQKAIKYADGTVQTTASVAGSMTGQTILDSLNNAARTFTKPPTFDAGLIVGSGDTLATTVGGLQVRPATGELAVYKAGQNTELTLFNSDASAYVQLAISGTTGGLYFDTDITKFYFDATIDSVIMIPPLRTRDTVHVEKAIKFPDGSVQTSAPSAGAGDATSLRTVPITQVPPTANQGLILDGDSLRYFDFTGVGTDSGGIPFFVDDDTMGTVLVGSGLTWNPATRTLSATGGGTGSADSLVHAYVDTANRNQGAGKFTLPTMSGSDGKYVHRRTYVLDTTGYAGSSGGNGLVLYGDTMRVVPTVYNIDTFGADGEGDDASYIQAACDAAYAAGGTVFGTGSYTINSSIVLRSNADFSSATFTLVNDAAAGIVWGDTNATIANKVVYLPTIERSGGAAGSWPSSEECIGIKLINPTSCEFYFGQVRYFKYGVKVTTAGTHGAAYNKFYFKALWDNQMQVALQPASNSGWVNENQFYGGRYSSAASTARDSVTAILIDSTGSICNNNTFIAPSLEMNDATYLVKCGGQTNTFYQGRYESTSKKVLFFPTDATSPQSNKFEGGYNTWALDFDYTADCDSSNELYWESGEYGIRSRSGSPFVGANGENSAYPVFAVVPKDSGLTVNANLRYTFMASQDYTRFKATGDNYPRLQINNNTGVVSWGSGAAGTTIDLYRYADNYLKLADSLMVVGELVIGTDPGDSAFTTASGQGAHIGGGLKVDSSITGPIRDYGGQVWNVTPFGAKGNDSDDDRDEINSTIAAASAAGGGVVYFPPGTYKVTATAHQDTILKLRPNVTLRGAGQDISIIKIASSAYQYQSFIGGVGQMQNITIENLTLDHNADEDVPDSASIANPTAGRQHFTVCVYLADNLIVRGVRIKDFTNVNSLYFNGSYARVSIVDNRFTGVGLNATNFYVDHSTIYVHGVDSSIVDISRNVFEAVYQNAKSTNAAIETHASNLTVQGNTVQDYFGGMNIASIYGGPIHNALVASNEIRTLRMGIAIWADTTNLGNATGLSVDGLTIRGNKIQLNQTAYTGYGNRTLTGISINQGGTGNLRSVVIDDNTVTFEKEWTDASYTAQTADIGIGYVASTVRRITDCSVTNNKIYNAPIAGIRFASALVYNLHIANNDIIDAGHSQDAGTATWYRYPIFIHADTLFNTVIENNYVMDTWATTRTTYACYLYSTNGYPSPILRKNFYGYKGSGFSGAYELTKVIPYIYGDVTQKWGSPGSGQSIRGGSEIYCISDSTWRSYAITGTTVTTGRVGAFTDKGGQVYNPVAIGADPTGTEDSRSNIQTCLESGHAQLPAGTFRINGTLAVPSGGELSGVPGGKTKLQIAANDTAILLQGQYATIKDIQIEAYSGYDTAYVGIASTLADRCYVENVNIVRPQQGIVLYDECHFNHFNSIYVYQASRRGIKLEANGVTTPNSNTFMIRELIGIRDVNQSIGIDLAGVGNTFIGGEIGGGATPESWDVAVKIAATGTTSNNFIGFYEENCDTSFWALGGQNFVNGYFGDDPIIVAYNAELTGPGGGLSSYNNTWITPVNFDSCRVIYTFQEGQGTTLYDRSGNGYDGTLQNGGTWTDGIYGKALQLTSASSHQISIPTAAIDPTRQYTIVMAWKPVTMSSNNALFRIEDGSDYHRISADDAGNYYKSYMNPSATSGTATSTRQRNSYWNWMAVCYDPVVGRFYSFDATTGFDSVGSITNDISTVSAIYVGKSVASTVATYGYLGIWQRKLSVPEVRSIVNSKSPVVAPSVPVLAKGTATFSGTNARVAVYIPGATSSDLYWLTAKSPDGLAAPILADVPFAFPKTDSLVVIRGTGGTSGLSVFWQRMK